MNKTIQKKLTLGALIFSLLIGMMLLVYADGYSTSQPSHPTLWADTITSRTDASPVSIADTQGLFVTGDVTTLGKVGIGTTSPSNKLEPAGTFNATSSSTQMLLNSNGDVTINFKG